VELTDSILWKYDLRHTVKTMWRFMSSGVEEGDVTAVKVMLTSHHTRVKLNQKCWQAIINLLAVCIRFTAIMG